MLFERRKEIFDRVVDADVEHLEAGAFEHHANQVLADVVDIALDRADDHLADRFHARFGKQWAQDRHAALHRICSQ